MIILLCLLFLVTYNANNAYGDLGAYGVNPDTISSIFNFEFTKFISDPEFNASINEIDDAELNNFVNSPEFNLFETLNPNFAARFDSRDPKNSLIVLATTAPNLVSSFLSQNPTLAEAFFKILASKSPDIIRIYSTLELIKIKHIEYIRSIEYNYEYQNRSILDYIGNNLIEKNFGLSFRILDFNFFVQKNSIISYLLDFLKNNELEKIENLNNGDERFSFIFNKIKDLDLLLIANLNILTVKFEFKIKENLSFGFVTNLSTNIPYLMMNIENDPTSADGFKPNAGLSLGLNLNNGLYIKYSFNDRFRLNSGILYTKKIYEKNMNFTEQSKDKAFDTSNFALFTKGIFDWNLSEFNYVKWFLDRFTVSNTIMLTRYNFDFKFGKVPYFLHERAEDSYNILKNYLETVLSKSFKLGRFFELKIPFGINVTSRIFGENGILIDEYENSRKVIYGNYVKRNVFEAFIGLNIRLLLLNISAKYSNLGWGGGINFNFNF